MIIRRKLERIGVVFSIMAMLLFIVSCEPKEMPNQETDAVSIDSTQTGDLCIFINGVSFVMKKVEGGTFQMGDDENNFSTTVNSFYIGETEVTQAQWKAVMGEYFMPPDTINERHPVQYLNWYKCQDFIHKLNDLTGQKFRLPSEAEWEFAARGGNSSKGFKYSGSNNIDSVAWTLGNGGKQFHEVKAKLPNELGLYDMSGNVCEWCQDRYVFRGGSWFFREECFEVSYRVPLHPSNGFNFTGFRLALESEELTSGFVVVPGPSFEYLY